MKTIQQPSLCETCLFRGLVTYIDPEANNQTELLQRFFCKAPNLKVNAEPFSLDIFSSLTDDYGNLTVSSTIVNCTEYTLGMTVTITGLSYDNNGHTTISYDVEGSNGTDTLNIFKVGNLTPIGTVANVANGAGTFVYNATLVAEDYYTFYGALLNANFISNRLTIIPEPEIVIANSIVSATIAGISIATTIANTVSDNAQIYIDGVAFGSTVAVSNATTDIAVPGTIATGAHTTYIKLIGSGVQSNPLNFTI